jgi:hypothetical protein
VSAVALVGALFAATSCRDFLGFQDAVVVQCILNSDCPDNLVCSGENNLCVLSDAGTGATSTVAPTYDGAAESGCGDTTSDVNNCGTCGNACSGGLNTQSWACMSSTCVPVCDTGWADCNGGSDGCETNVANDPNNCGRCPIPCDAGTCASVCSSGVCETGQCATLVPYGYEPAPDPLAPFWTIASGEPPYFTATLTGVLVRIMAPGTVIKLGFVSTLGGQQVYVGLYRDNGGMPTELLTQNAQAFTIPGSSSIFNPQSVEIPVTQLVIDSVADPLNGDAYWILEESNQLVQFQVYTPAMTRWYEYAEPAFGPLKSPAPASADWNVAPTPAFYLIMAQ